MSFQATMQANIADIRERVAEFMIDTCIIRRKVSESVVNGEIIPVYEDGETVKCRLIVRSGSETSNIAAQERLISQTQFTGIYRIQLPFTTDINVDDRIDFTDIFLDRVTTFEVIFVPPFHKMTGAFIVTIREVK